MTGPLFEESVVNIRPVDLRVTKRAGLVLSGLVVERRCAGRIGEGGGMAREAQQVHIADLQQVSVGRAVRRVARVAAFDLHRLMFEYKRAALVGVTRVADNVLRRGCPHLLGRDGAVRIVAVGALDEILIHAMVERHLELRFLLQVARITKLRLRLDEQELRLRGVVRRVARNATDVVFGMDRIDGFHVLNATGMAGQATVVDFLGGVILEDEDLGFIAAALDVSQAGAVASFASLMRRAALGVQGGLPVRSFLPIIVEVLMAGLASLGSHVPCGGVLRRVSGRSGFRRRARCGALVLCPKKRGNK